MERDMVGGLSVGLDVGSISVKAVVVGEQGEVISDEYIRHNGKPVDHAVAALEKIFSFWPGDFITRVAITGSGGRAIAEIAGAFFVNEVAACSRAAAELHPEVRTVIDIGGEDSKLIFIDESGGIGDFSMNTRCAAGTGMFLDEQAARMGYTIEEFAARGLKSSAPPRIAGRCSVFAKSDMIHLQQLATPDCDIIAGLAYAMARNFRSSLGKGGGFPMPILFQGGVAGNRCLVRAFRDVFEGGKDDFIVPTHFTAMNAIGAVLIAIASDEGTGFKGLSALRPRRRSTKKLASHERLSFLPGSEERHRLGAEARLPSAPPVLPAYLGVDVGSISTNVVALDEDGNVLAKSYLMTASRPIEAVQNGLREIREKVGDRLEVRGVGTTGSGRYLTGDLVGADVVRNEITAQAKGATAVDPEVDTIFEIGGQDSKYIRLENGVVVDFAMNHVCSAGTGSFLEEQADRLGISIKDEFANLAMRCERPAKVGERCTVFIQSDLIKLQQQGASVEELVSGLAYSIVNNYLNSVVERRRIGDRIFFQGGTAANRAIIAAFEKVTGKPITVPAHHEVTGAIGAALLAKEYQEARGSAESKFTGFDLAERKYKVETFQCRSCANECEIRRVIIEGHQPLFYGSRCDKFNMKETSKSSSLVDLFKVREELLDVPCSKVERPLGPIGLPRALFQHDLLPFWKTFLLELGFDPIVSSPTNREIVNSAIELSPGETCFPVKLTAGHIAQLAAQDVTRIFVPSIVGLNRDFRKQADNRLCPYVTSIPYTMKAAFSPGGASEGLEFLAPVVRLDHNPARLAKSLFDFGARFGLKQSQVRNAVDAANAAQKEFRLRLAHRVDKALRETPRAVRRMVIVGRPYNSCDRGLNLDLPRKLLDMGVLPIPMDAVLTRNDRLSGDWSNMYWKYGQRILAVAEKIVSDPSLDAIFISNFSCGPDSFLAAFFQRILGSKPALVLEIDEHSADAGVITRLEAFLDSLAAGKSRAPGRRRIFGPMSSLDGRTAYIPHMGEHSRVISAAFRSVGIPAESLPPPDEESVIIGRQYTCGKECLPAIITTGDIVKCTRRTDFDPERSAFFMPSGNGPCRFGQYHKLHRLVLKDLGLEQVPVISPNQGRDFYEQLNALPGNPIRPGWHAMVSVDMLQKLLHRKRPYERNIGEADAIFERGIVNLCRLMERQRDIRPAIETTVREFLEMPLKTGPRRPVVGIVGEIYVRHSEAANNRLVRRLENLGLEVDLAPVSEWIYYTNFVRRRASWREGNLSGAAINVFKNVVQHRDEDRLSEYFRKVVESKPDTPIREVLHLAAPYIHDSFEGEAVLTVGRAIELQRNVTSGIVNIMPFTCMPGMISGIVLRKVHDDLGQFPLLNLSCDGQEDAVFETRLEAFACQVNQFHGSHARTRTLMSAA